MANIILNKQDKSIKIVYRKDNIRLRKEESNISLKHSGKPGPPGPTGVSTFVRVHHLADPNIARPNAQFVEWVGSVAPNNGTTEDTWIDTA